jgi:hypothetical protein
LIVDMPADFIAELLGIDESDADSILARANAIVDADGQSDAVADPDSDPDTDSDSDSDTPELP